MARNGPGRIRRAVSALRAVEELTGRVDGLERELIRLSPQVAALEERFSQLSRPQAGESTPEDRAEAQALLDAVRAEHARVRARISAATVFEERLRVLEERLDRR